jgi:hypothetical protein
VESAASHDDIRGFAILNRSYKLHNGLTSIDEEDVNIDTD